MTIAISLKVNDGVVLAADSALTISKRDQKGATRVYYNAHKVFKLSDDPPVGMVVCGCGVIGQQSIATIIKDLRSKLLANNATISVKSVAEFYKTNVNKIYEDSHKDWPNPHKLTCIVAGYCQAETTIQVYVISMTKGDCKLHRVPDEYNAYYDGQTEAIERLLKGYSPDLREILSRCLRPEDLQELMSVIKNELQAKIIVPSMPIHDAVDLVRFLVQTTIDYAKFSGGPQTVGGPIEIATITKHAGYKWIERNTHYVESLNVDDSV